MLNDYRPPTWKDRLSSPMAIAAIVLVVAGGSLWGWSAWTNAEAERAREAIEPLRREWDSIRSGAVPRLAAIEGVLANAPAPVEQRCAAVPSAIEIVHRPVLRAIAAGERLPRLDAPHWLSSTAYGYLAESLTPHALDERRHRHRNDVVTAALARPCVGVIETDRAEDARITGAARFDGGAVAGWLRVVCLGDPAPRIACQTRVASQALVAVSVVQNNPRSQAGANASAVSSSSSDAYWESVDRALTGIGAARVPETG